MNSSRSIADLLASKKPVVSVEFYPPRTEKGGQQILEAAEALQRLFRPDFVSITFGAGGSTRERTVRYAAILKDTCNFEVMPHLTCVGSSRDELIDILGDYKAADFRNIMALRGDAPADESTFQPHPGGLRYGSDLVELIRKNFPGFCVGVAGYPETHPEAVSAAVDLEHLKFKVDQGASFITTQLFFDNRFYFDFVERCRKAGIEAPIIPGLMPVLSLSQVQRFCAMCKASLPKELVERLEKAGDDPKAVENVGIQWAFHQIEELAQNGVPGFHLYILNKSRPALEIMKLLKKQFPHWT